MIFREEITLESIRVRIKNLGLDPGGFKPKKRGGEIWDKWIILNHQVNSPKALQNKGIQKTAKKRSKKIKKNFKKSLQKSQNDV